MTYQEAIKILKMEMLGDSERMECAKQIAVGALKKQVPKKPIKELNEIICPNCKTLVGSNPYCKYCGQALGWNDLKGETK